ncbi:cupredoxin domain-containing protein [bacterium]|nr:cupredoxin domain-containing protein [bacterium]
MRVVLNVRLVLIILSSVLLSLVFIGCGSDNATPVERTIILKDGQLNVQHLTIPKGSKIIWKNMDGIGYTIQSGSVAKPTVLFRSSQLTINQKFEYTFDYPGTYVFHCTGSDSKVIEGTITVE